MKKVFKFVALVIIATILFIISNGIMPFSDSFKAASSTTDPLALLFMIISYAWVCATIIFIITKSNNTKRKTLFFALISLFTVGQFMTQIETLFFGSAFTVLNKTDTFFIMIAGLIPLLFTVPLAAKFFKIDENISFKTTFNTKKTISLLLMLGIIYMVIYFIFGYFIAWQCIDLRVFYSGSSDDAGFIGQLINNLNDNFIIYPFQICRGVLFSSFILPLLFLFKNKKDFIIATTMVFLTTAIVLIIPNVLFPDTVRIQHFYEMFFSMLLFGIIVGNVLWLCKKQSE